MSPKRYLIIRFSAMGDVVISSPVVKSILHNNPGVELHFLSKSFFEPLFEKLPGFRFIGPDLKKRHSGLPGIYRLYLELKSNRYLGVVDLHSSLRSRVLGVFFKMSGVPVFTIDKGRREKKQLLKNSAPGTQPLKHSAQRYLDVFGKVGLKTPADDLEMPELGVATERVLQLISKKGSVKWLGMAPFAAHTSKEWPLDRMEELSRRLRTRGIKLLWFGAGKRELRKIEEKLLKQEDYLVAGNYGLDEELFLMRQLDAMVCMDSANMHMAAVSGIPVVSIWGPTHPNAGFWPMNNTDGIVQAEIKGRPCTVYGKIKGAEAAKIAAMSMEAISVDMVLEKIEKKLQLIKDRK